MARIRRWLGRRVGGRLLTTTTIIIITTIGTYWLLTSGYRHDINGDIDWVKRAMAQPTKEYPPNSLLYYPRRSPVVAVAKGESTATYPGSPATERESPGCS